MRIHIDLDIDGTAQQKFNIEYQDFGLNQS